MSDTTLNRFLSRGSSSQRASFTPDPPVPASGPDPLHIWYETDTEDTWAWDGVHWVQVNTAVLGSHASSHENGGGDEISVTGLSGLLADAQTPLLTSALQLVENAPILFDAALSADGQYSGLCIAGTAGATLAFGDLCYLAVADSRWELTDADAEATAGGVILGVCVLAAAADGDPTRMLLMGNVRADTAFPALTIGAPAYVGTTAGDIQVAQPSGEDDVIRVVGHALTADELMFRPSQDWMTYTV